MFSNMAENNSRIISFKTAQEVFKNLNLGQKRQVDKGNNDFEIIEDILHHEGVELIKFSDQNLDPERLVSFCVLPIHFYGFEKVQSMTEIINLCAKIRSQFHEIFGQRKVRRAAENSSVRQM